MASYRCAYFHRRAKQELSRSFYSMRPHAACSSSTNVSNSFSRSKVASKRALNSVMELSYMKRIINLRLACRCSNSRMSGLNFLYFPRSFAARHVSWGSNQTFPKKWWVCSVFFPSIVLVKSLFSTWGYWRRLMISSSNRGLKLKSLSKRIDDFPEWVRLEWLIQDNLELVKLAMPHRQHRVVSQSEYGMSR